MVEQEEHTSVWHSDHHVVHLLLNRSQLVISEVLCPGTDECNNTLVGCVVKHFLKVYGLECNVGVIEPTPQIEIAWTLQGNPMDIDSCQVWVIPVEDDAFAAWAITQK